MARVVHLTTIVIVVLASAVSKRRTFLHYSNYLKKSQPHHWKYDQEELGRRVEQIARGHQVRAQLQPLHPHDAVPWHQWTRAARLAALNDVRNREINQVRTQLLQQKLSLKPPARQPLVLPQVKPKIRVVAKNPRHKGDLQEPNRRIRTKREIQINPQLLPEVVKQSHNQPAMTRHTKIQNVRSSLGLHFYNPSIYYPEVIEALTNRTDPYQEQVKRNSGKRQILYWVKPVQQLRAVATTPDPNNFETEKQEPGEQKSPDLHSSYQLNEDVFEWSKIKLKFYLTTSTKDWPEIQKVKKKISNPLSQIIVLNEKFKVQAKNVDVNNVSYQYKAVIFRGKEVNCNISEIKNPKLAHRRVKRRVNKTLKRKWAKKRKQKQRRVERKRLRMLTHARRLRKQQKSKQARLERHYARMNMTGQMQANKTEGATAEAGGEEDESNNSTSLSDANRTRNKEEDKKNSYNDEGFETVEVIEDKDVEYEKEDYEDENGDDSHDDGNDSYGDYDEDSGGDAESSESYINYENVDDTSKKTKEQNLERKEDKIDLKKKAKQSYQRFHR